VNGAGEEGRVLTELVDAEHQYRRILRRLDEPPKSDVVWPCAEPAGSDLRGLAESGTSMVGNQTYAAAGGNALIVRLLDNAPGEVADEELLQVLVYLVAPTAATEALASRLIERFGSLGAVLSAREADLLAVPDLPREVARLFRTVRTTLARLLQEPLRQRPVIDSFNKLLDYLQVTMRDEPVEMVRILFLDRKNQLIKDEMVARGTVDHAPLYPREVLRACLDRGASAIILVHNHPSGDPVPSEADVQLTRQIDRALATLDIALHDHVVIGRGRWTSFRQQGLLPPRD
jgi:DNA repair protein RadC